MRLNQTQEKWNQVAYLEERLLSKMGIHDYGYVDSMENINEILGIVDSGIELDLPGYLE